MLNLHKIQNKWQKKWKDNSIFNVEVKDYSKKKYYITTPYPYMSGLLHLGHVFTYIFPEILSRYKRMQGFNVMFKFGFHCTGTPIVAAAQRVKENEKTQIDTLLKMGIPKSEINKFSDPEYWIKYFPKETLKDLNALGFSIDERYSFITTSLNKQYDAFIRWQFNKLKELGFVKKGKHPVVWCPKDNLPVGDHDRSEGEGETPQEFCLFKFKLDDKFIITATLRPDTFMGITNLFLDPNENYITVKVNKETWIVGKPILTKLKEQGYDIKEDNEIKGEELIGKKVEFLENKNIPVLPANFLDINYGTGIVHSVPSDSADDLIALMDLQQNEKLIKKYKLDYIKTIEPIEIFDTPEIGSNSAKYFLDKYNVKNQNQRDKLDQIKKELYKLTFAKSKFNNKYKKIDLQGKAVSKGQKIIQKYLIEKRKIELFYELTRKVKCRCLTECIVKIVSEQWFIEYNDLNWKKKTHKCLTKLKLYPEVVRKQFEYVLDWLHHWACSREFGLGTKLPWNDKWIIESLSDSTLQMAYNTISKDIKEIDVKNLNDSLFDYVFLNKGKLNEVSKSTKINENKIEKLRKEFTYWYPFDFRNSAKDLIQNHLAFCLFNHTAIFPEKLWPKSYSLNGRVMVDNEKMSKSKGNFFTARELYTKNSSDVVRITAANSGEGIDDANFDMKFMESIDKKLIETLEFSKNNYNKGRNKKLSVDTWFESTIHTSINKTTQHMDNIEFKSALLKSFFDMQRHLKWYSRRTQNSYNKNTINLFIETQAKMLAPFTPHIAEEIWQEIKGEGFISNANWPKFDNKKINSESMKGEELISNIVTDIQAVLKLAQIEKPKEIKLIISSNWKYKFMTKLKSCIATRDFKLILKNVMIGDLKKHGKDITKIIPKYIKLGQVPEVFSQDFELNIIKSAEEFLSSEFNSSKIIIEIGEKSTENKSNQAMPNKPAILVK